MKQLTKESLQCVCGLNIFMWIINAILCGCGCYFILNTYSGLNKDGQINNCDNVYLLTGISVGNALISVIGCNKFCLLTTLSFASTVTLAGFNLYTVFNISHECKESYTENFFYFWIFYNICISVQLINFLCSLCKCILLECGPTRDTNETEDTQPFISPVQGTHSNNLKFYIKKYNTSERAYPYAPVYPNLNNHYEDDYENSYQNECQND